MSGMEGISRNERHWECVRGRFEKLMTKVPELYDCSIQPMFSNIPDARTGMEIRADRAFDGETVGDGLPDVVAN